MIIKWHREQSLSHYHLVTVEQVLGSQHHNIRHRAKKQQPPFTSMKFSHSRLILTNRPQSGYLEGYRRCSAHMVEGLLHLRSYSCEFGYSNFVTEQLPQQFFIGYCELNDGTFLIQSQCFAIRNGFWAIYLVLSMLVLITCN